MSRKKILSGHEIAISLIESLHKTCTIPDPQIIMDEERTPESPSFHKEFFEVICS